jgi:hypothetical protein
MQKSKAQLLIVKEDEALVQTYIEEGEAPFAIVEDNKEEKPDVCSSEYTSA